jgi:hypothetical protein
MITVLCPIPVSICHHVISLDVEYLILMGSILNL